MTALTLNSGSMPRRLEENSTSSYNDWRLKMGKFNKTMAAVVGGAVATLVGSFVTLDAAALSSIQTIVTALLVWFVPNAGDQA